MAKDVISIDTSALDRMSDAFGELAGRIAHHIELAAARMDRPADDNDVVAAGMEAALLEMKHRIEGK